MGQHCRPKPPPGAGRSPQPTNHRHYTVPPFRTTNSPTFMSLSCHAGSNFEGSPCCSSHTHTHTVDFLCLFLAGLLPSEADASDGSGAGSGAGSRAGVSVAASSASWSTSLPKSEFEVLPTDSSELELVCVLLPAARPRPHPRPHPRPRPRPRGARWPAATTLNEEAFSSEIQGEAWQAAASGEYYFEKPEVSPCTSSPRRIFKTTIACSLQKGALFYLTSYQRVTLVKCP